MARTPFQPRDYMYELELALQNVRLHLIELLDSDECYQCLQITCCCQDYDEAYSCEEEDFYYDYFYNDYIAPPLPEDLPQPHFHTDNHWTLIETEDLISSWTAIQRREQDKAWTKAKADLGLIKCKESNAPSKDQPAYLAKIEKWFAQEQTQKTKAKKVKCEECVVEVIKPDWPPADDSPWCFRSHQVPCPSLQNYSYKNDDFGYQQPNHSDSKTMYSAVADFFKQFAPKRDGFYTGLN